MTTPAYDSGNIFARILRGEIPCQKLLETPHSLAFHDVNPQAPVHVLVIPKGAYVNFVDFAHRASAEEMTDYLRAVAAAAEKLGLTTDGFRGLFNNGANAHQEVPHLHTHLFGGRKLGPMLVKD